MRTHEADIEAVKTDIGGPILPALIENMIALPVEWRKALGSPAAKVSVSEANTSVNKVYTLEA